MNKEIKKEVQVLFEKLNEIRGSMYPSGYKNYILSFIFYRYISEKQEKIEDSNPEDIKSKLGYYIAPENTWTSLINKINNSEIKIEDYQKIFEDIESNENFEEIFSDINLNDLRLGSNINGRISTINNIILTINDIDESVMNGNIFEEFIDQFASNEDKKGGEYYTPVQIRNILSRIVTSDVENKDNKNFRIYDPTMGSASLLIDVGKQIPEEYNVDFFGQERNTTTYNMARMNLSMHDISNDLNKLNNNDTLENDWPSNIDYSGKIQPEVFDAVISNPPYSLKWDNNASKLEDPRFSQYGKLPPKSRADYAFILHSLYHLNETGTMAIILPLGVLFRGGAEEKIRKTLIEKNYLDAVIGLPSNLLYSTSIPIVILVFKKNRENKDILFIDASEEFEKGRHQNNLTDENVNKIIKTYKYRCDVEYYAHLASIDEIKENEYNLNIPRYVDTYKEKEPVDLEKLEKEVRVLKEQLKEIDNKIVEYSKNFKL